MASLRKRANGRWQVRWRDSADVARSRHFPDRRSAQAFRREVEVTRARGEDVRPRDAAPPPDLPALQQAWLDWQAGPRGFAFNTLASRRSSCLLYQTYLRARVCKRGRLGLELLNREGIEGFLGWMRTERGVSKLTARGRALHMASMWRWACEHSTWRTHVDTLEWVTVPDAQPELRPYAPTWAECDGAVEACRTPWHRNLLLVCRYTGLRVQQAMRLTWGDIDLAEARLAIRPELGKTKQERRGRIIPVSPHLVTEVSTWGRR